VTRLRALLRAAALGLQGALLVAFPLLVFSGVSRFGARRTAVALGVLLFPSLVRAAVLGRARLASAVALPGAAVALLALAAALDDGRFMLAYPVLVNAALLARFGLSLRGECTFVEELARLTAPDLSLEERRYCRSVTVVWCAFFAANGVAAAALAAFAPRAWWAAYTGAVSYVLVGVVFSTEYVVRKARFGRFGRGPVDRLLAAYLRRPAAE
jgi:uncharacterized membrane protein